MCLLVQSKLASFPPIHSLHCSLHAILITEESPNLLHVRLQSLKKISRGRGTEYFILKSPIKGTLFHNNPIPTSLHRIMAAFACLSTTLYCHNAPRFFRVGLPHGSNVRYFKHGRKFFVTFFL